MDVEGGRRICIFRIAYVEADGHGSETYEDSTMANETQPDSGADGGTDRGVGRSSGQGQQLSRSLSEELDTTSQDQRGLLVPVANPEAVVGLLASVASLN
jgi:hypothetical protein